MNYYQLSLNMSTGTKRSIKINNPATGLSEEEIEAAVNQIIENDVFDPAKGSIAGVNQLELVTVTRTTLI